MNLASRLLAVMKTISDGGIQQDWLFNSTQWTIGGGGKVAIYDVNSSGYLVNNWRFANSFSSKNVESSAHYFEVKVSRLNVGDSNGLRIGFRNKTTGATYQFVPRGAITLGQGSFLPYMEIGSGVNTRYLWGQGDIIGCSIERNGGNTDVKFWLNGVNYGVAWSLTNLDGYEPYLSGYLNSNLRYIELAVLDYKYLPAGFESWE